MKNGRRKLNFEEPRILETEKSSKFVKQVIDEMLIEGSEVVVNSRVLTDGTQSEPSYEEDDDGGLIDLNNSVEINYNSFKIDDLVWGEMAPNVWWPGYIRERDQLRVLVSFFGVPRSRIFKLSEIRKFKNHLHSIPECLQLRFKREVDYGLAAMGIRVISALRCSCKGSLAGVENAYLQNKVKKSIREKMEFEPRMVLDFIYRIAGSSWIDNEESVYGVRSVAQAIAFRSYAFAHTDWIYNEMMRLSGSGLTSDDNGTANADGSNYVDAKANAAHVVDEADAFSGTDGRDDADAASAANEDDEADTANSASEDVDEDADANEGFCSMFKANIISYCPVISVLLLSLYFSDEIMAALSTY